jgi:ribosomal protein S18 acetylase RimI-like enzyme
MTISGEVRRGRLGTMEPSPTFKEHIRVRDAAVEDLPALGRLAADLVAQHHAYDPARFLLPRDVEKGYRTWFGRELQNADAILLVAEREAEGGRSVAGYAYGRVEGRDWNMLLDRHAALHDVLVGPEARGHGAGEALVRAFLERARARKVPRVVLHSATPNTGAQRLFAKLGFRPTMVEMTCELGPPDDPAGGLTPAGSG